MPFLQGSDAWLDRAEEHFQDLVARCSSLSQSECDAVIRDLSIDHPKETQSIALQVSPEALDPSPHPGPAVPVSTRISILVGEITQALRRSLDYVVYELAWLDSGIRQNGTQFPIDDHTRTFEGRRKGYLIGVSDKHAAAIKRLQPFQGTRWTKILRTLSNPDKHRHLTIAMQRSGLNLAGMSLPAGTSIFNGKGTWVAMPTQPGELRLRVTLDDLGPDAHVEYKVAPHIAFDDGSRVVESLDQLKAEVAHVLEDFRPCFDGHCHH